MDGEMRDGGDLNGKGRGGGGGGGGGVITNGL